MSGLDKAGHFLIIQDFLKLKAIGKSLEKLSAIHCSLLGVLKQKKRISAK